MTNPPDRDSEPRPLRLEYFAANVPRDPRTRGAALWWTVLGLGWLPFACGVVSSRYVVESGLPELVRVHVNAGIAFMALGGLLSVASLVGFSLAKNRPAAAIAGVSFVIQVCLFLCVGGK